MPVTTPMQGTTLPVSPQLIRWCGLAALVAGVIFAGIQPIHPPDVLASVTTPLWAVIITLKLVMCFLFLIGVTGLYARQAHATGWVGLVGYAMVMASWSLQIGFVFVELFVLPPLASVAPEFINTYLGVVNGMPGTMEIGALVPTYAVLGLLYVIGNLALGIATVRAGILPRWPAILLAAVAVATPVAAFLPHALQRMAAGMPMGIAMAWLGYALWSERGVLASVAAR